MSHELAPHHCLYPLKCQLHKNHSQLFFTPLVVFFNLRRRVNNQGTLFLFLRLEAAFNSPHCITLPATLPISPDAGVGDDSPARTPQDDTNTHSEHSRRGKPGGKRARAMEEGGGQREAELNDLRDAASPQEAKRPSVILHTPTGWAPAFGFFLIPRCVAPPCVRSTLHLSACVS